MDPGAVSGVCAIEADLDGGGGGEEDLCAGLVKLELDALAVLVGDGGDGLDQALLIVAIDLDAEAVVVESLIEIKTSGREADG